MITKKFNACSPNINFPQIPGRMKKIYLLLPILFLSIAVCAQEEDKQSFLKRLMWNEKMLNIMLDMRIDAQTNIVNGDNEERGFNGQTLKLWVAGEIIPGIRYRVRHRFNKSQMPGREGYSAATDHAWLAFDIKEDWTLTVGKQSVQFGTFEYDYSPSDVYLATMCFNDLDAYKIGVNAAYRFLGQTLNLQVVNSDAPQFASDSYRKKALAVNVLWEGDFADGLLKTRWAYGAFQHSKTKFYNWLTAGTQLNINKFTAELDYYLGNRDMDYGDVVGSLGSRYVKDQSLSLNLKLNLDKWRPFIKGTWNQRRDKEFRSNAYENMGVQTVVEYYPFSGLAKDLRFHFAYHYNSTDYQGAFSSLSNRDEHSFLLGTRWLFKVK